MKRFVFLLLTAWLLSSGFAVADANLRGYAKENGYQYLAFGRFPQTTDWKEQPLLWRILSATDKEAYLLSEYILFNNRVHPDDDAYRASGGAFNQTEIYALLNGPFERIVISPDEAAELRHKTYYGRAYDAETSFYEQAFTAAEKAMILDDKELGRVFLPSADDLKNADYGFGTNPSTKAYGTHFAIAEGRFRYSNGSSPYWTRTQSADFPYGTRCTKEHGNFGLYPLRGDERGDSSGAAAGYRRARTVRWGRYNGKPLSGQTITVRHGVDHDAHETHRIYHNGGASLPAGSLLHGAGGAGAHIKLRHHIAQQKDGFGARRRIHQLLAQPHGGKSLSGISNAGGRSSAVSVHLFCRDARNVVR